MALPKPCLVESSLVYFGNKLDFELQVGSVVGGPCWGEAELQVSTFSQSLRLQRWEKQAQVNFSEALARFGETK